MTLFLCRFDTALPVLVSLPADASEGEARAVRTALRAYENAGLGVRFREVAPARANVEIRFVDDPPPL
ncbi:MAG: hypothetical protein JSU66_06955, partial [Deltaproteobacteria bacterium]